MKVLLVNGSPRHGGTYQALLKLQESLKEENIESEIFDVGNKLVSDCMACGSCAKNKDLKCVIKDDSNLNEFIEKANSADGFVFGTPVYYAHANGRLLSFMDRAFYAGGKNFAFKPAAAVACARRAGTIVSIDDINKYFTINQMPIVSSTYWNEIHGNNELETSKDEEGMQTMYNLGKNMAWILKCINVGKEAGIVHPENEKILTNFIR